MEMMAQLADEDREFGAARIADILRPCVIRSQVMLSSGRSADLYCDVMKALTGQSAFDIAREVASLAASAGGKCVVAGVEAGGAILAGMVVGRYPTDWLSLAIVRKAKRRGSQDLVVGYVRGMLVLLVDDVATTGGSLVSAVRAIRDAGGIVERALVVVDREEGARERLADLGVELTSLCTLKELAL